jgi:hypothetical protein
MGMERRNQTALGRKRRREFERSAHKLRELGMPEWAVEYYRRAARVAGLPPHMVVCHVAVVAAGRQMQSSMEQAVQVEAEIEAVPGEAAGLEPGHGAVTEMQRRVAGLWREIQRHSERIDAGENPFAAPEPDGPRAVASSKVTLLRHPGRDGAHAASKPRGRKPQAKGH